MKIIDLVRNKLPKEMKFTLTCIKEDFNYLYSNDVKIIHAHNQALSDVHKTLDIEVPLDEGKIIEIIKKELTRQLKISGVKNVWIEQGDLAHAIAKGDIYK